MTPHEKRPRQYAQEIATLPTAAARNKALGAVPPEMRDLVRDHVESAFAIRRARRRKGAA